MKLIINRKETGNKVPAEHAHLQLTIKISCSHARERESFHIVAVAENATCIFCEEHFSDDEKKDLGVKCHTYELWVLRANRIFEIYIPKCLLFSFILFIILLFVILEIFLKNIMLTVIFNYISKILCHYFWNILISICKLIVKIIVNFFFIKNRLGCHIITLLIKKSRIRIVNLFYFLYR